jgi:hypothetical protein
MSFLIGHALPNFSESRRVGVLPGICEFLKQARNFVAIESMY